MSSDDENSSDDSTYQEESSDEDSGYFSLDESSSEDKEYYDDYSEEDEPPPLIDINFRKSTFYGDATDNKLGFWIKDLPYILFSYDGIIYRVYLPLYMTYSFSYETDIKNMWCLIDGCETTNKNLMLYLDKYTFTKYRDEPTYGIILRNIRKNGKKFIVKDDDYKFFIDPYELKIFDPVTNVTKSIPEKVNHYNHYEFYKQFKSEKNMYENMLSSNIVFGYASSNEGALFRNVFEIGKYKLEIIGIASFINENIDKKFKTFLLEIVIERIWFQLYSIDDPDIIEETFKNILLHSMRHEDPIEKILLNALYESSETIYDLFSNGPLSNPFTVSFLLTVNGIVYKPTRTIMGLEDDYEDYDIYNKKENVYMDKHNKLKFKIISEQTTTDNSIYIFSSNTLNHLSDILDIIKQYKIEYQGRRKKDIKNDFIIKKLIEKNKNLTVVKLKPLTKHI